MKRIALLSCVLISLLFFLLSGCSHADAEPQISSFTDFETKYKRASFSELIDNPSTFLSDFSALNSLGWGLPNLVTFSLIGTVTTICHLNLTSKAQLVIKRMAFCLMRLFPFELLFSIS